MDVMRRKVYRSTTTVFRRIRVWTTGLSRCPFVDTCIPVGATAATAAAAECAASIDVGTCEGCEAAGQGRADAGCGGLGCNFMGREEGEN